MRRWIRPAVVMALLGLAAFLLILGLRAKRDEEPPVRRTGLSRVFPEPGTVAVRQGAIGVELSFGYSGRLSLDSRDIPDDQLDVIAGINRISFTPGPDKEFEALDEGRHCASVTFWVSGTDPASAGLPFTWCFTAA